MGSTLPKQAVPFKEKSFEWGKANIDYYVEQSGLSNYSLSQITDIYRAYEGEIDADMYKYVTNPYNSEENVPRNLPAKMRSINILKPVIDAMTGEKIFEPSSANVISTNPETENEYLTFLSSTLRNEIQLRVANTLKELGIDTGSEKEELPPIAQVMDERKKSFKDSATIQGQNALEYLIYANRINDKHQECWKDYIITGRCYSYKDVRFNDVHYEYVRPDELWVAGDPNTRSVELKDVAVRRKRLTFSEAIDKHRKHLSTKDLEALNKKYESVIPGDLTGTFISTAQDPLSFDSYIYEFHIVWKTQKKIKILTYTTALGEESEKEVDETYKLDKTRGDIKLDTEYINAVAEGYRLDENIYPGIGSDVQEETDKGKVKRPNCWKLIPLQRQDINNTSKCRLPYSGIVESTYSSEIVSYGKMGLPFQVLFNIYHYRLELMMAANKGKLLLMPKGLKPKGWSYDKWLYTADSTRMLWWDETHDRFQQIIQAIKDVDLSTGQYIADITKLLEYIKNEWWDTVGFNRQRLGEAKASDGKAVTQEALHRSGMITAELSRKFTVFQEEDKTGLIDASRVAWIDGKKAKYVNSLQDTVYLNIEPEVYALNNYDVFHKVSKKEKEKIEMLKAALHPLLQNGLKANTLVELIDEDNFAKIKVIVDKADKIERQYNMSLKKMDENTAKIKSESDKYKIDKQSETSQYVADSQYREAIEVANIRSLQGADNDADNDGIANENATKDEELAFKRQQHNDKMAIERNKANQATNK